MAKLTAQEEAQYAYNAGFRGQSLSDIVGIAWAESRFYTTGDNTTGNYPAGSRDRGVLQINNYWHPDVSDACANDPQCANNAAYRISKGGTDFSSWVTFKSGAYQGESEKYVMPNSATGSGSPTPQANFITNPGSYIGTALQGAALGAASPGSPIGPAVQGAALGAASPGMPTSQKWIEIAALFALAGVFVLVGVVMLASGAASDTDVGQIAKSTVLKAAAA